MAEGLLQMLGSGQQAQQQQQGNLLGGLFQSENQARRQGRERLLGQALQIAQQQDPIRSGFAVAGGLLGEGIGRAMGKVTPEEARQQKFAGLQTQLMQEGLDPAQDPSGFYTRVAELSQDQGDLQTALRAAAKAREFAPEPIEPATFYNQKTNEYVRGGYRNGVAVNEQGQRLGEGFVERDFETPDQTESFTPLSAEEKEQLGVDPTKFAQRNDLTGRVHTSGGQTINVGDEANPAFDALTDQFKNDLTQASEAATQATGLLEEVNRATDILSQEDFSTGRVRPVLTSLRGIAEDLGVSVDPALREAGVENLGEVSDAESFRSFSSNLTTRLAERLPGNLNQQEINLISDASSQLGKTPEANAAALASFRAGAELAQRNASRLTEAAAEGTGELIAEQRRQRERGVEDFEALADRYKKEILEQRNGPSVDFSNPTEISDERLRELSERAASGEINDPEQLEILADEWDRRGF